MNSGFQKAHSFVHRKGTGKSLWFRVSGFWHFMRRSEKSAQKKNGRIVRSPHMFSAKAARPSFGPRRRQWKRKNRREASASLLLLSVLAEIRLFDLLIGQQLRAGAGHGDVP
ncbi:hypothetical protein, partial [uncultured Oscillibacter sp.]|uniref:hypothetical protein n=1 Tax=uncultured Oscillibacter sp. TaxID=876091 RepID=UPI0025850C9C